MMGSDVFCGTFPNWIGLLRYDFLPSCLSNLAEVRARRSKQKAARDSSIVQAIALLLDRDAR